MDYAIYLQLMVTVHTASAIINAICLFCFCKYLKQNIQTKQNNCGKVRQTYVLKFGIACNVIEVCSTEVTKTLKQHPNTGRPLHI